MLRSCAALAVMLGGLVGCSRPLPDVATRAPEPQALPAPKAPAATLFRIDADLDGTGPEVVTLTTDGLLRIGSASLPIELAHNEFFFDQQASLRMVEIDATKKLRAILFTEPTSESEDPPNRYRVFLRRDGSIEVALDRVIGVYGVDALVFPGKGDASFVEDGWTACTRAGHPLEADRLEVKLELDPALRFVETTTKPSGRRQTCASLAG